MFGLVLGVLKSIVTVVLFCAGVFSVVFTQTVGLLIFSNYELLQAWIATTKQAFIVLLTALMTFVSNTPIKMRIISPDIPSSRLNLHGGQVSFVLPQNTVIFANHQIYTDWVYLWWLTYLSRLSGFVYIILKDSLAKIPVLGYGMKNYDFIFLSRKWEKDKVTMGAHLDRLDANGRGKGPASGNIKEVDGSWPKGFNNEASWPYSLIIFPEGTNLSANTRGKTEAYAAKVGKKPFRNVLLPKTTGLRFSLLKLRDSVQEVVDVTIGYSGVKSHEYGQDIYRLEKVFLEGKSPEKVEFWIRTYKIDEIPIGKLNETEEEAEVSKKEFEEWLFKIWKEKDELLDNFYDTGSFVTESNADKLNIVETKLTVSFYDFIKIFSVPFISFVILRLFYTFYLKFHT